MTATTTICFLYTKVHTSLAWTGDLQGAIMLTESGLRWVHTQIVSHRFKLFYLQNQFFHISLTSLCQSPYYVAGASLSGPEALYKHIQIQ